MASSESDLSNIIENDIPADFKSRTANGRSLLLHNAVVKNKNAAVIQLMLSQMQDITNFLIIPYQPYKRSYNALEMALINDNRDVFYLLFTKLLKDNSAYLNYFLTGDVLPLGYIADKFYNNTDCHCAIRQYFPDFLFKDAKYEYQVDKMLELAVVYSKPVLAEKMLAMGANVDTVFVSPSPTALVPPKFLLTLAIENTCLPMVEVLLKYDACLEAVLGKDTPLHTASCFPEVIGMLLKLGINPNSRDKQDKTALHRLAGKNPDEAKPVFFDAVQQLIVVTEIDAQDKWGDTALHIAVRSGCLDTVNLLIKGGASINAINKEGETPLFLAATSAREDQAGKLAILLSHHADLEIVPDDLEENRSYLESLLEKQLCEHEWSKQNADIVKVLLPWFVKHHIASEFLDTPRIGTSPRKHATIVGNPAILLLLDSIPPTKQSVGSRASFASQSSARFWNQPVESTDKQTRDGSPLPDNGL